MIEGRVKKIVDSVSSRPLDFGGNFKFRGRLIDSSRPLEFGGIHPDFGEFQI